MPRARDSRLFLTIAVAGSLAAFAGPTRAGHPLERAPRTLDESEYGASWCRTPLAVRAYHHGSELSPEGYDEIKRLLTHKLDGPSTYVSPLGYFSLQYVTVGPDSVSIEDVNPSDGVPDFVQRCAEYADRSWVTEIDSLGFVAPELPPDGTYDITLAALPLNWYGYAAVSGTTTEIFIHRSFTGFGFYGSNDDPDGPQLGRAKVTIAHEFKHASQFATSDWTEEISWMELDAMWVEDLVYPLTDEYQDWVANGSYSQLDAPWVSLDVTDSTGYEDCLWQHYLSGTWGSGVVRDYWTRRGQYPGESSQASYQATLMTRGSNWKESYAKYLEWCWFTGSRAEASFGFPDAAELWRMELYEAAIYDYPFAASDSVPHIASHPRRFSRGSATGFPRVRFDGSDTGGALVMSAITRRTDGSFWIAEPQLDSANACDWVVGEAWPSLQYVAVLVSNGDPWGAKEPYTLEVLEEGTIDAAEPGRVVVGPRLDVHPNPARGALAISFDLPSETSARLRIFDVRGRTVRTLSLGTRRAGAGTVRWDTRDAAGNALPAGVYWAELDAGRSRVVRRVTLLR